MNPRTDLYRYAIGSNGCTVKSTTIIIAICFFVREVTCRDIRLVDVERVYETLEWIGLDGPVGREIENTCTFITAHSNVMFEVSSVVVFN